MYRKYAHKRYAHRHPVKKPSKHKRILNYWQFIPFAFDASEVLAAPLKPNHRVHLCFGAFRSCDFAATSNILGI